MDVVKKINIDLSAMSNTSVVYAVQNDYGSRKVEANLFSNGTPWAIPAGCVVSVSYKKPDGTTGWYDKLEDGSNAISYSGNVVTVSLAAQSLTVAGDVFVSIVFNEASTLKQLASFPFVVNVSDFPSDSGQVSNNFYNYGTVGELNEAIESLEKNVSKIKEAFYIHVTKREGVYYSDKTYDEIYNAVNWYYTRKERPVYCILWDNSPSDFIILPLTAFDIYEGDVIFTKIQYNYEVVVTIKKESVECGKVYIPYKDDIPERLPNPYPLTINGRKYDGSKEVTILDAPLIVNVGGGDNGYNADTSIDKIDAARRAGRIMWCRVSKSVFLPFVSKYGSDTGSEYGYIFSGVDGGSVWTVTVGTDGVKVKFSPVAFKTDIPTALPNPQPLTINGHTYDGSAAADIVTTALTVTVNPLDEGGYTCDKTMDELKAAHNAGRELYCVWGARLPMVGEYGTTSSDIWGYTFRGIVNGREYSVNIGTDGISVVYTKLVPDKLPNPEPLTINGKVYDGSEPVEVALEGGGADGETPYIGDNDNWWIGEEDTGVKAAGKDGRSVYSVELDASQSDETKSVYFMTDDGDGNIGSFIVKHGQNGYAPVRGVDYWTEEDKEAVDADIAVELAKRGQLKPEFANSIDECTDTSKLYVLPDGYLYAYMLGSSAAYKNILPSLVGPDLSGPFNGVGYMDDSYVSTTAPYYSSDAETVMPGLIPFGSGNLPTIYIKGLTFDSAKSHTRFGLFNSEGVCTQTVNFASWADYFTAESLGDAYYKLTPVKAFDTAAYIAFSGVATTGANVIITLDEPIVEGTTYAWRSTGHAFVPADYEDRIVGLEEDVAALSDRVTAVDGIPAYVQTEGERVIQAFLPKIADRSLNFIALADFHEPGDGEVSSLAAQIRESNLHACQGAKHIAQSLRLDLLAVLGDKLWGSNTTTMEQGRQAAARINRYLSGIESHAPVLDTPGNHDTLTYSYEQNQAYFRPGEMEALFGGYGYRDFEDKKCRVIVLNTMDYKGATVTENTGVERVSGEQLQWFAETLDLSGKEDAADWRIILMAHHPLDYMEGMPLANCLQAYLEGSAYAVTHNGVEVSYDFSGKNAAWVLYQFHGHLHNYKVDYIHYLNNGTAADTTVKRVCIPNACFYRSNEYGENGVAEDYGIEFGEENTYAKTAGTAEDTAFCLVTVDLDTGTAHAIHYGAGIDREISY